MANISYNNPGTQGTGGGGAFLAQWLIQKEARENQISNASKAADYLRKSFGENAAVESGIDDQHWDNMSAQDQAAWAQGYQDKQALNRMQATTAAVTLNSQTQADERSAQAQQRLRDSNDGNVFASVMKSYGQQGQPAGTNMNDDGSPADGSPYGALPSINPQEFAAKYMAAGGSPYGLEKYGRFVKDTLGADPSLKASYTEDPATGARAMLYGKQALPTGFNPEKSGQAVPITDEDGNVIGQGLPGKGGVKLIPPAKGAITDQDQYKQLDHLHQAYIKNAGATMFPEQKKAWEDKADAVAAQMDALLKPKAAPAASDTPVAGLPTATNKKTGEKMVLKDGKWQPLK